MKRLVAFFIFSAICLNSQAIDRFANGLTSDSVDPVSDSIALKQIRNRLNQIRKAQNRPTVALVLCGGGAKGAAEVGAMHLIEELDIPIDFVCGTSIGSLIGGLYAVGYDVDFLDSIFRHQDWKKMLSDKVESKYIPLAVKKQKAKYQLSIPFHYEKDVLDKVAHQQEIYSMRDGKLHLNETTELNTQNGRLSGVISSMPSGYVYGMHINKTFSDLTVGYHDSLSFSALPIPFACVATELVSCKAKHWGSGELKTAMRSSMGIPGLFTSVRTDGMVLSDGGTRNNFPVDIAKAVGADIIIGIDLTDPMAPFSKINNIGTVLRQYVTMLVNARHDDLAAMTDVYIRPELSGYTSLSFNTDAVDSLIANGYRCALQHKDELLAIKARVGDATTVYKGKKAIDLTGRSVTIKSISFSGMNETESRILHKMIKLDISRPVDADELDKAISIIQGSGAVESVTYSMLGGEEPFDLVFECAKSPTNRIGVGVRLDSEVWAEVGLNFGWNVNKLSGPKLDANLKLGMSQSLDIRFMLDTPDFPTVNLEVYGANVNGKLWKMEDSSMAALNNTRMDSGYLTHREKLFISLNDIRNFESWFGFQSYGYFINGSKSSSEVLQIKNTPAAQGNYLGAFLGGNYYTMDNFYCPASGVDLKFGFDLDFLKFGVKTFRPVYTFNVDIRGAIPFCDFVTLIPDFHIRGVFDQYSTLTTTRQSNTEQVYAIDGKCPEYSFAHRNFLGGDIAGRYIGQQIPFVGFNNVADCTYFEDIDDNTSRLVSYDHLAVLNLDLRFKAYKELYVSALGGYAHMAEDVQNFVTFKNTKDLFAAGLQLTYNTIVGPIRLRGSWSNRSTVQKHNFGAYLSIGFNL